MESVAMRGALWLRSQEQVCGPPVRSPCVSSIVNDNGFHFALVRSGGLVTTHGRIRIGTITVAALTTATLLLAGCSSTSSKGTSTTGAGSTTSAAAPGPVNVVASSNVWGDITKQIGGDHVNVTSILSDPNADPHQYEADAKTGAAISGAQVVVENGLGYDDFMDKLLAASPNANRAVINAADVMKISGSDANPHIWYDIAKVPDVASAIADQLGRIDPADAATFTTNAKTLTGSLAPIIAALA